MFTVVSALALWAGATLLLARLPWFSRRPLAQRIRPYATGSAAAPITAGAFSVESFRHVVEPVASHVGARVAEVFGVDEDLATRLQRVHSPIDPATFRVRQLGWSLAAFAAGAVLAFGAHLPLGIAVLAALGPPLFVFLVVEQRLARESEQWQHHVFLELPVVTEQLGMLLSAGYSLGAALNRIADRGKGRCGRDLQRVAGRVRHGLSEVDAVREWADIAKVDALDRLTAVLALNRDAGDLARLVGDEARSLRRDVHRQLIVTIERRSQQVWIPVTVATLVPGVIFLTIPFMEALRLLST